MILKAGCLFFGPDFASLSTLRHKTNREGLTCGFPTPDIPPETPPPYPPPNRSPEPLLVSLWGQSESLLKVSARYAACPPASNASLRLLYGRLPRLSRRAPRDGEP